ncbi:MAG: glycerol-3-phosphate 1-O-acyltransferase PlsY [Lachnospiraceae bacterium]|nr:glycerol-3-phosphate 1-O-acyltransferase PlsY [Lachnospiraceae bacterium]
MERILCLLVGYAFGLFQTAYIYGRMNGIDIRQHGSGNAGTTNALRTLGKKAGAVVLVGDIVKCMLAIFVCEWIFGSNHPEMVYLVKIYAAAGAILGHNFPFYLGFKGGKGIAATGGLVFAFNPWFIPVGVGLFFGNFFITHYVSIGSLLVYVGFMIQLVVMGQLGYFGMSAPHLYEMYFVTLLLAIMAFYKHRDNISRLLNGTERKTYLNKKNKE